MLWNSQKKYEKEILDILEDSGATDIKMHTVVSSSSTSTVVDFTAAIPDGTIVYIDTKNRNVLHPTDIIPFSNLSTEGEVKGTFVIVTPGEPDEDEVKELANQKGVNVVSKDRLREILR